jgi:acyl-CoA thioester hydrolase
MEHSFSCRVYYEDTDLAGIVYYANYLKFIERARSEWVRAMGVDQVALKASGLVFAVRRVEADYLKPAKFDDFLRISTRAISASAARIVLCQNVWRGEVVLFEAVVTLVCLADSGPPARLPADLRRRVLQSLEP